MKKLILLLIALSICIGLVSCTSESGKEQEEIGTQNQEEIESVKNLVEYNELGLPPSKIYQAMWGDRRLNMITKAESIPINTAVTYFEKQIKSELIGTGIRIERLDIYKDDLLMEWDRNQRKLNNMIIDLELKIDEKDWNRTEEKIEEFANTVYDKLIKKCFDEDTYSNVKLDTIRVNFLDTPVKIAKSYGNVETYPEDGLLKNQQSKEELTVQKTVFDFTNEYDNLDLKRFGLQDKFELEAIDKELYIGIGSFGFRGDQAATPIDTAEIGDQLNHTLQSSEVAKQYFKNKGVKTITINFEDWTSHQNKDIYEYQVEI